MNEKIEQRSFNLSEVNESSDGLLVRGLVNKSGAWSQALYDKNGKPFIERVMPNVFARALQRAKDVKLLNEHDKNMLLARTKDGTLQLTETSRGLEMEANLVPSKLSEHIHASIKRGTLSNMSFGMVVLDDVWTKEKGVNQRSITDLALYECSIVSDPAYEDSTIEARSNDIRQDVEIPNFEERGQKIMNLDSMSIKQLEERKQELLFEANGIEQSKTTEQRSFTPSEQLRQEAILSEVQKIKDKINSVESRNQSQRKEEIIMTNTQNTFEKDKRGLEQFLRREDGEEVRSVTTGATPGMLTIPSTISDYIVEKLFENAPLFGRTQNFTPTEGKLEILREKSLGTAGWFGEGQVINLNDFSMDKITLEQKRVGTAIELSQQLINDSGIDVVGYATKLLTRRLGITVDASILIGDKTKGEFEGILNDVTVQENIAASSTGITLDELLVLSNSIHPDYVKDAVFIVNRQVFNEIAKMKDGNGHYHLVKDVAETGVTYRLFGQPVLISESMPNMETGKRAVVFANLGEGYATMTKKGQTLKYIDNDTANALKGTNTIVLDAYMDGKVLNQNAIVCLKMK
ncbi:phage major capsid protein [Bacillus thuringiensis serovar roskildiensis]|uniref:Phage major capsid protein n=1 Tax=Bacillus thuringiensis serovar sooncheon TaxID=180891 RepID=A0A9Q5X161_BACTU|nr:phage major capsid protein [Bacillus thuringiensis]OTW70628.1 phage major capsid protein [Bacillus thuringiensis serovar coreanensis]OTX42274.1 phage major capsid protein [Bacillus thuringiensis serovar sooncheon]OTX60263.1 phage major capsid protein [Bacillus thuringiensis serovar guiyangiensis]OTX69129.1 phage major capsid protein [Bacillus thuringiensis serovar roskildiensis]